MAEHILLFAELLFGPEGRHRIFEPLVADWQRQFQDADSRMARLGILLSGASALLLSALSYSLAKGPQMPGRALLKAIAAIVTAGMAMVLAQMLLNGAQLRNDFPIEMRMWMALPMVMPLIIPLALLWVMMTVRSVDGMTRRGAVSMIVASGLLTIAVTGWFTPLMQADVRDELYEAMYQRDVENDRAGRISYPATAVREVRRTTTEERARLREQFRQNPRYLAAQAERTRPRWNRSTFMTGALAVAMGLLGWALGGLRRRSAFAAAGWCLLAWIALMIFDGRFLYPGIGIRQYIGRAPFWLPTAVFGTAALLVVLGASRHQAPTPAANK